MHAGSIAEVREAQPWAEPATLRASACNPLRPPAPATRCAPTRCAPTRSPTCGRLQPRVPPSLQPYVSEVGEVEQPKLQLDEAHYDRFRCWECATLLEA